MTVHPAHCTCDPCLLAQMQARSAAKRRRGWEAWYRRDAPRLLTLLERRCRAAHCQDYAEDILHECFVIGFRNIASGRYVDHGVSLCGYLYGIAKNLLGEMLRLQRREAVGTDAIEDQFDGAPSLDEVILMQELCTLVQEAHTHQSLLDRQVVHALYREGKTSEALARELGKTAGNTRIIAHRAVTEMVKYLHHQHHLRISSRAVRAVFETL